MPRRKKRLSRWKKVKAVILPVSQFLLDKFLELVEILPQPLETPYRYARRLEGWPVEYPRYRVRQELKRMKDRGWIIEAEKNGQKFLKLTEQGKMEALYQKLKRIGTRKQRNWDGKWRLAFFDIPEKGRRERDAIRWTLKSVGFHQLQKSVYIYPHEIPGEVIAYLREANLLSYIRFGRVDKMDDHDDLKKHFRLRNH